jgi:DNA repair protein RecO (recombination protein O)
LELVARGTKKIKSKLAGHLEPASLINLMVVRGKQYDYAGFADGQNLYANIKNDYEKILICGQAFNYFNKLIKIGEYDEDVFYLLKDFLESLNSQKIIKAEKNLCYYFFIFKLLSLLGYTPELYNCIVCKTKILANNKTKFAINQGGLICEKCQNKQDEASAISDNCVKMLRLILESDFDKLNKIKITDSLEKELSLIIESYKMIYKNQ